MQWPISNRLYSRPFAHLSAIVIHFRVQTEAAQGDVILAHTENNVKQASPRKLEERAEAVSAKANVEATSSQRP